jgi:hypothetical protein
MFVATLNEKPLSVTRPPGIRRLAGVPSRRIPGDHCGANAPQVSGEQQHFSLRGHERHVLLLTEAGRPGGEPWVRPLPGTTSSYTDNRPKRVLYILLSLYMTDIQSFSFLIANGNIVTPERSGRTDRAPCQAISR